MCYKSGRKINFFKKFEKIKKFLERQNFLPLSDNYLNKSIAQVSSAQLYCVIYSP